MTESLEKFKDELKKLFRADDKDLNWGIPRIMNQKNEEIDIFISKELPKIVNEKILSLKSNFGENIEKEIEKLKKSLEEAGVNPENAPRYQELLKQKKENKSVKDFEDSIYNHLITFFSRYYQDGDFISQFFFKEGTYLIPYDGSEVDLHWVTKDMYFIKTSDQYSRFVFKAGEKNVLLKMVSAEEEKGNVKGKTTYFDFENITINGNEVEVGLKKIAETDEIKALGKNKTERQKILNEKIKQEVEKEINIKVDIKNIEKFQRKYVEDFFIHKDLKGFLTNQMKFYLNQEIVDVDSYINDEGSFNEDSKIIAKVFKDICLDIIEKLSLLEELKKKIWEKKKFVLESNYVITLDKIAEYCGEEFLEEITNEIISNKEQLNEWKELFDIEVKNKKDLIIFTEQKKLNEKEKTEWKKLPIDTKHFSEEFKWNLLSKIEQIDEKLNGVLMHSENWQALNLLQEKYREKVQCCYIDPPYNTGSDEFIYKDGFLNGSWISFMDNRINKIGNLLGSKCQFFCSIDDNEIAELKLLLDSYFSKNNLMGIIHWRKNRKPHNAGESISKSAEYILVYSKENKVKLVREYTIKGKDEKGNFSEGPIFKADKKIREYTFFKGIICKTNNIEKGWNKSARNPKLYIEYIDKPLIKEGILQNDVRIRGRFCLTNERVGKLNEEIKKGNIYINSNGIPKAVIYRENELGKVATNLWVDKGFNEDANDEIKNLFAVDLADELISHPKPTKLINEIIKSVNNKECIYLDYFGGSGTTADAIIRYNKNNDANVKSIIVEMANYFYELILPRIKKVLYSLNWKDGKPQDMDSIGGFFKYHDLEQYEDSLENIKFKQSKLDFEALQEKGKLLSYILDQGIDKNKSKNFLGVDTEDEFLDLKIKILNNDGTTRLQNVDLIETFIYLIGLEIDEMKLIKKHKPYYVIKGKFNENPTIIIWRKPNKDEKEQELDRDVINSFLQEKTYKEIFVNSDCLIQNYKNIYDEMRKRLW